jgi:uncharacterized protein YggE
MRPLYAAFLSFALLTAAPAAAQAQTQPDTTPTIAADGIGIASLTPDLAAFEARVSRAARTSASARQVVNRRIAAVLRAARASGVAATDIRTADLSLRRERVRKRIRYQASQSVQVLVRDVSKLGAVIDAVTAAGAEDVGDPDYSFADPTVGRQQATQAALADARKRADAAAAAVGLRITGVRTVDLHPGLVSDSEGVVGLSGGSDDSGGGSSPASGLAPTRVASGMQRFVEVVRVVYTAAPAV